ncbi:MAG: transposase, partial [Spirochaetaceae bacterium]|nr:transposase [Spirochaetaceae bacterium]
MSRIRTDMAVRYICGNRAHPGHNVICRFWTENREGFKEVFMKVLVMALERGYLKKEGNISVDGTKIHTNASKHSAVSYKRAVQMIEEAKQEVKELIGKTEEADSRPLDEDLTIPKEALIKSERSSRIGSMKTQQTFTDVEYGKRKRISRREVFLDTMESLVPWEKLKGQIRPHYFQGKRGRPPKGIQTMLRMYLLRIWFNLADEALEEHIYDSYAMRKFMGLDFSE